MGWLLYNNSCAYTLLTDTFMAVVLCKLTTCKKPFSSCQICDKGEIY